MCLCMYLYDRKVAWIFNFNLFFYRACLDRLEFYSYAAISIVRLPLQWRAETEKTELKPLKNESYVAYFLRLTRRSAQVPSNCQYSHLSVLKHLWDAVCRLRPNGWQTIIEFCILIMHPCTDPLVEVTSLWKKN